MAPDHAPDAVQLSALFDVQVSVELSPLAMVCGLAEIVTVGAAATVTVAAWEAVPPLPVQLRENVAVPTSTPVDSEPPVALTPDHAPEAVQPVASVDDHVSVELAPLAMVCGLAVIVTVGAGAFTVTVADCETLPPLPVQFKVNVLLLVSAPVDCEPLVALAPDHAPEAVQPVASVDDQVNVELAPLATVCGLAVIVTVGAGAFTVIVADCETLPPLPVQFKVNVLLLVRATVGSEPLIGLEPDHAPDAVQLVALVDDQVNVELAPLAMVCGLAEIVTVGAGAFTVTVADCETLPPLPVQVSVNVLLLVKATVDSEPPIALAPDHTPEAVQLVASVDDHASVELAPLAMVCGLAEIVTVGGVGGGAAFTATVADCETLPPLPVQFKVNVLLLVKAPVDSEPLIGLEPDHDAPNAVQLVALVDDQVSVEVAPLAMVCGLAEIVTVGAGAFTVTVADCEALPPLPVQLKVNVLLLVKAPVDSEPLIGLEPDHDAPNAVQLVALVDDQVSVEVAPLAMVCGLAEIVTVGGGAFTVTVADCETLPPLPVHISVNVPELVNIPVDWVPLGAFAPDHIPEAVQPVASVDDQVSVELAPLAMVCGLAEMVTVGAGAFTVTVADCDALPPMPEQLKVKVPVPVSAPVDCEPLTGLEPDHAPNAVQLVALVDDHVSVELAPLAMVCGLAEIVTVGASAATVTVADCEKLPPLPVQVSENVLVLVRVPVDCEPLVVFAPDHAPEAVQLVALVDDQARVEAAPFATTGGFAPIVTVGGGGDTVTVVDSTVLPPAPVQASENVLVPASTPVDWVPLVALGPDHAPEAVQSSALIDDHVSVELAPLAMLAGFAPMETVGAGGGVAAVIGLTGSLPQPPSDSATKNANSQVCLCPCMGASRPFISLTRLTLRRHYDDTADTHKRDKSYMYSATSRTFRV